MRRLTGNEVIWISLLAWASFIPLYQLVSFGYISHEKFTNIAHALVIGTAFTIWLQWIPAVYRAFKAGYSSGADMFAVAVWALMFVLMAIRVYALVVNNVDPATEKWIRSSFLVPIAPWALFGALILMMFAPGTKDGNIPLKNYGWFVFAGFIGSLVTGISIGLGLSANFTQ